MTGCFRLVKSAHRTFLLHPNTPTGKLLRLFRRYRPQMPQIALISHQHNHNIRIGMIPQLFQPPLHILVRLMLADIIHQQSPHSAPIVCGGDSTVAFLPCCIPDLGFDGLGVDLDGAGCELDADGGFAVKIEFVAGES